MDNLVTKDNENCSFVDKITDIVTSLSTHLVDGRLSVKVASMATLTLHAMLVCDKSDIPRLVGKGGQTINAMRTLLHASVAKDKVRTYLFVAD